MVSAKIYAVWKRGCIFSINNDWGRIEEYASSNCICLAVRSTKPSAPLVSFISCMMTQLLEDYFPKSEYQLRISCTHCVQQRVADLWSFPSEECESALLNGQSHITCKQKANRTIPVDLKLIVPDLALTQNEGIKINLSEIEMEKEQLAEGAYGVLYRGIYKNETVAVKLLRTEGASPEDQLDIFREFRNEISIMGELLHENIVQLKGFCFGNNGEIGMVMEYVDSGDLHHLIRDKSKNFGIPIICKIAFDISEGLLHLHSCEPSIIHRDLKPGNILLSHSNNKWKYTAKLADFGLSTRSYFRFLKKRAVETPMWLSPEILCGGKYSLDSDVFAFGIILYEMVERKLPYENFDFRFLNQLEEEIISGKRCDISKIEESNPKISQLISNCWHQNPEKRPNFIQVMKELLKISKSSGDKELYKYLKKRYENIISNKFYRKFTKAITLRKNKNSKIGNQLKNSNNDNINEQEDDFEEEIHLHIHDSFTLPSGSFIKSVTTDPPETATSLAAVGNDIWVTHKNGDISIWNALNGEIFRKIVAAHPREIQTISLIGNYVWTGSLDGMVRIWQSRAFPHKSKPEVLKEGYLEPVDSNISTIFVKLHSHSKELIENVPLINAKIFKIDTGKSGFLVRLDNGNTFKFYCANVNDRENWVKILNEHIHENLCEETKNLKVAQIHHNRRLQIHSFVHKNNKVFVGASDLIIRVYDATTFQLITTYQLDEQQQLTPERNESSETPTSPVSRERTTSFFPSELKRK